MTLTERLTEVAVIGAGGKMGRGISLLLAQEMILLRLSKENRERQFKLTLMDVSDAALRGLHSYLSAQAGKFAGKQLESLKAHYPGLESNQAIEERFTADLLSILNPVSELAAVQGAHLVFEAVLENIDLKVSLYRQLKECCSAETYFFSNTSSIPIRILDERAGLNGRIIGFHFYNPPAVQKLVELIIPERAQPELLEISRELGRRLKKIIIDSNDVAGFIGNGHFIRDGLHGISEAERLGKEMSLPEAVYTINRVSQEFLIRPMGIFQLIDYVGLDIFQSILAIMNSHFAAENLHSDLIDTLVAKGVKGGQYPDSSQKAGFFQYRNGQPQAVYDFAGGDYKALDDAEWRRRADARLGELPAGHHPWKALLKDPNRREKLTAYFINLVKSDSPGNRLAKTYLKRSREIGKLLVSQGVANSPEDVNGVLMNGFFHLYGPINDYL